AITDTDTSTNVRITARIIGPIIARIRATITTTRQRWDARLSGAPRRRAAEKCDELAPSYMPLPREGRSLSGPTAREPRCIFNYANSSAVSLRQPKTRTWRAYQRCGPENIDHRGGGFCGA